MLILWGLVSLYIIVFFSIMALVGVGYLAAFAVRRVHSRKPVSRGTLPVGVRRAYTEDALKAA
jgi:hypothetical protein